MTPARELAEKTYTLLIRIGDHCRSPLLLLMRLYWGWHFFLTGKGKLANLDRTAGFFADLHIPLPKLNAVMAGSTECFGGLLLLLGLASRLVSVPLMIVMVVAYLTADIDKVKHIFSNGDAFVTAAPFQFLLVSAIVFAFGPGCFSVDQVLRTHVFKPRD